MRPRQNPLPRYGRLAVTGGLNPSIVISEGRQTCQTCQRHDGAIVLALKGNIEGETAWATG